jgi:hypothetical protein
MSKQTATVTDAMIRKHLGHGEGNRKVIVKRNGKVHYYGSTDPVDRSQDWTHYAGTRAELSDEVLKHL